MKKIIPISNQLMVIIKVIFASQGFTDRISGQYLRDIQVLEVLHNSHYSKVHF